MAYLGRIKNLLSDLAGLKIALDMADYWVKSAFTKYRLTLI
jgi:hypothetical protein